MTFHMNGEQVQLIPIPGAHTDGDTLVKFVNADVIMTGEFYRSTGYPNIDRANGGSLPGMWQALTRSSSSPGPSTKILPGHGAIVDKAAVAAHRDLIIGVRDKIAPMVKKGMTVEQVTAAKPTSDYDAKMEIPARPARASSGSCMPSLVGNEPVWERSATSHRHDATTQRGRCRRLLRAGVFSRLSTRSHRAPHLSRGTDATHGEMQKSP